MQCKEQHFGVTHCSEVGQAGEEEPPLQSVELRNRRRLRADNPREQGWLVLCEPPKRQDLPLWIKQQARQRGHAISPAVAELLAELCGYELGPLADALERVCRSWSRVRDAASPGAYAHRVAINLANSRFRRLAAARRAATRLDTADAYEDGDLAADVALRTAIMRLPWRQRVALVLRYYVDLTPDEIGEQLGCSAQAVRNLTHRAIATMRGELKNDMPLTLQEVTDGCFSARDHRISI
jgi:RNA polymerase sigma factor (sigma-70 family)